MKCIILRGLPSSGKTTYCKSPELSDYWVASADSFFYTRSDSGTDYDFDPTLLPQAHQYSRETFRDYLSRGLNVIVDNTNLTAGEISWYYNEAVDAGYEVKIVTINTDFETCFERESKGVPLNTMVEMYRHFKNEVLPPWWEQEVLVV